MIKTSRWYKVSEGAGLDTGRVGLAVKPGSVLRELNAEAGRYKPFDKRREVALIDEAGVFSMFPQYLTPCDGPETFFVKTPWITVYRAKGADPDMADWVVSAYDFLLPRGKAVTAGEFADAIEAAYSQDDPHNAAAVNLLRSL